MARIPKLGTLDLSAARYLLLNREWQNKVVDVVSRHHPAQEVSFNGSPLLFSAAIRVLFLALADLHTIWRKKELLSPQDIDFYHKAVEKLRAGWTALQWKPTVWVHWIVRHSGYFASTLRNFYLYSSIPSERRHQGFKRDMRHWCQAWKVKNPKASKAGLRHVVDLDALDHGIQMHPQPAKRARHSL